MREGWEIKAFDACIEKRKAPTKLLSSSYQEKGLYPIVSQEKDLISGYWDNPDDLFVHRKPVVVFGDHTMVVKYIDFDFVVGADGVKILEPKEFLLPKYFFYWVSSVHIKSRGYARHFRYLREASVPIPSLTEQQRIVDILDREFAKIDALKANAEKSLQAAKDLFQATLKKELEPKAGWHNTSLHSICKSLFAGGDAPKGKISKIKTEEYSIPILSNGIGENAIYGYTTDARVFDKAITISARGTIGYVALRESPFFPIVRLIVAIPGDDILAEYLKHYLTTISFRSDGTAIPQLTIPMIKDFVVTYPSKEKQRSIVSLLNDLNDRCKSLQDNYQKTLTLCDDLKQSLLRKAFNGEL